MKPNFVEWTVFKADNEGEDGNYYLRAYLLFDKSSSITLPFHMVFQTIEAAAAWIETVGITLWPYWITDDILNVEEGAGYSSGEHDIVLTMPDSINDVETTGGLVKPYAHLDTSNYTSTGTPFPLPEGFPLKYKNQLVWKEDTADQNALYLQKLITAQHGDETA